MTVKRFFIMVLVLVASAFSGLTLALMTHPGPSRRVTWSPPPGETPSAAPSSDPFDLLPSLDEPMNILVMGTDLELVKHGEAYKPTLNGRTDTMMLAHVRPDDRRVYAVSIPRDTRVLIPGVGIDKANAANVYGGAKLVEQTLANFLNVPIDRYVRINTAGVIQMVDALGGVTLYVAQRMHYNDFSQHLYINFNQGWHHLNGAQAQAYIRFRHDNLADIGRIQRQQQFMHAMMEQVFKPATILKIPQILQVVRDNLDTDLSTIEIFRLMRWANGLTKKDMQMVMLPGDFSPGSGTYWLGNPVRIERFLKRYRYTTEVVDPNASASPEHNPAHYGITVKDGVGNRARSKEFVKMLRKLGYQAGYGGNTRGMGYAWPVKVTQIIAQKGDPEVAEIIREKLGMGEVVTSSIGDLLSDFTIIMGQDWVDQQKAAEPPRGLKAMERQGLQPRRSPVGQ